jgi:N-acyl-D-amino-acid deacylase
LALDLLIKNGRVIDGAGNPWYRADVGIKDGKIAQVFRPGADTPEADREIDAVGKIVCPGFIDAHSHSDFTMLGEGAQYSTVMQGVTTEVVGNCGIGYAPITPLNRDSMVLKSEAFQPNVSVDWSSFGEYLETLERKGLNANAVYLLGHSALRTAVIGMENRPSTQAELEEMKVLLEDALRSGAKGMSSGMEYLSGRYAKQDELIELAKIVQRHGKLYATHMRNRDRWFEEATREQIEISEQSGVNLQLSHLNVKPGASEGAWYRVIEQLEQARAKGIDVSTDTIPFAVGPGLITAIFPAWAMEKGIPGLRRHLDDPNSRERLKKECDRYWMMMAYGQWDRISLAYVENSPELIGMTFEEISKKLGKDPFDCIFDILLDEPLNSVEHALMNGRLFSDEHVIEMVTHPLFMLASDGWGAPDQGPVSRVSNHPNCYGWTAVLIEDMVGKQKVFSLEEAIRKMTTFPAQKFGLQDRGLVREGMVADLVIMDEKRVRANSTYADVHHYTSGIDYVFIAGEAVVAEGKLTGATPGHILK